MQALAKEIGEPKRFHPNEEGFYQSEGYHTIQETLQRFVELDGISEIFTDICLVQSKNHKILASVNGYNGQRFEEIYAIGTRELIQDLAEGGRKGNLLISIGGEATPASSLLLIPIITYSGNNSSDAATPIT